MQLEASQGTRAQPRTVSLHSSPLITPQFSRLQPAFKSMTECNLQVCVGTSIQRQTATRPFPLWRPRGVAMHAVDQNSYPRVLDMELKYLSSC